MKKLLKATLLDLLGAFLFIVAVGIPIFKIISVLFPLSVYFYTWHKYKKIFWKAYIISIIILGVLIFGSILILMQTEYKYATSVVVMKYVLSLLS